MVLFLLLLSIVFHLFYFNSTLHGGVLGLQGLEGVVPLTQGLLQDSHKLGNLHVGWGGMPSDAVQLIPGVLGVPTCWHPPVLHRTSQKGC